MGGVALSVAWLPMRGGASQAPDVKADYDRSNSLNQRIANKVFDVAEAPNWIEDSQKFWYRKSARGANAFQFVLVDPATATKAPAFDHAQARDGDVDRGRQRHHLHGDHAAVHDVHVRRQHAGD